MIASVHPDPAVLPGLLEEISAELQSAGVAPQPMNILHHALSRGIPEDLAVVVAQAAERLQEEAQAS